MFIIFTPIASLTILIAIIILRQGTFFHDSKKLRGYIFSSRDQISESNLQNINLSNDKNKILVVASLPRDSLIVCQTQNLKTFLNVSEQCKNNASVCSFRIKCDENDNINEINMAGESNSGTIPSELSQLTAIQSLYLINNQLTGSIPSELSQLTAIQSLYLYTNQLTGSIPSELRQLTVLQVLLLNDNQLTGSIPSELSELTALQYFDLSINQLKGTIPSELSQLTALQYLYLNNNQLTGSIPSELRQLTVLQYLHLDTNQLTGSIPSELSELTVLQDLFLNNNQLTGSIPSELRQLSVLQYLYLNDNQLTGSIPSELRQLTVLQDLFLNNNQLTGSIPSELSELSVLQYLYLNNNQLTGSIPSELRQLTVLQSLYLNNNQLTGSIPSELSQLTSLQDLYLNDNQLTGSIPSELSQLTVLQDLRLFGNQLTGTIPETLGLLSRLQIILLYNNQLTGCIPVVLHAPYFQGEYGYDTYYLKKCFNRISNFDFSGNNINNGINLYEAEATCRSTNNCIGFNGIYGSNISIAKNDFGIPGLSTTDFYIQPVHYGGQFALIEGWRIPLQFNNLEIGTIRSVASSASQCAYMCTMNSECQIAVWERIASMCSIIGNVLRYTSPESDPYSALLIPVGNGGCSSSLISSGNCISSYYKIPYFDFQTSSNIIPNSDTLTLVDAYSACNNNVACIGFNSTFYGKQDFSNPITTLDSDFYVHAVGYGTKFSMLKDWQFIGGDLPGMPIQVDRATDCAYECINTRGCVGAIWDSYSLCWLKYYYNQPFYFKGTQLNMLIPVGDNVARNCPPSILANRNCIESIPYNIIPGFDFGGNNILDPNKDIYLLVILSQSAATCTAMGGSKCYGFTDYNYYKSDLIQPYQTVDGSSFYMHAVRYAMKFVILYNWNSVGTDLQNMPLSFTNISECAYACTITHGCIGATWTEYINGTLYVNGTLCWLKSTFSQPFQKFQNALGQVVGNTDVVNMLIPIGSNDCPQSFLDSNNCVASTESNDKRTLCLIMVDFNIYKDTDTCFYLIDTDFFDNIAYDKQGYLTTLKLSGLSIASTIPSLIGNLTKLELLILNNNQLYDLIPSEVFQLTSLKYLDLSQNQLFDNISSQFSQFSLLQTLLLNNNQLSGTIPKELFNLTLLKILRLDNQFYTPSSLIINTPSLSPSISPSIIDIIRSPSIFNTDSPTIAISTKRKLIIVAIGLFGTIPTEIGQLTYLEQLRLDNNKFSNSLPTQLGNLKSLLILNISANLFDGSIPSELGLLTQLQQLLLSFNQFDGTIPSQLGNLKVLQYLSFDHNNKLSGILPDSLCQIASLIFVSPSIGVSCASTCSTNTCFHYEPYRDNINACQLLIDWEFYKDNNTCYQNIRKTNSNQVYFNNQEFVYQLNFHDLGLTSTISSHIGQLTNLRYLNLDYNRLSNSIPSFLGQLTWLNTIYLNNNQLNGTVPSQLGLLTSLQQLDLSSNQLTGCVPTELSSLTQTHQNFANNPDFCPASDSSSASSKTLSTGAIVGIVFSCLICVLAVFLAVYYYGIIQYKDGKIITNNVIRKNTVASSTTRGNNQNIINTLNNKSIVADDDIDIPLFSWDDITIDIATDDDLQNIIIGQGSFGQVVRAQLIAKNIDNNLITTDETVVKIMKRKNQGPNQRTNDLKLAINEVKVHLSTENKIYNKNCIVKVFGIVSGDIPPSLQRTLNSIEAVGIVMRYEAGGTLTSILRTKDSKSLDTSSIPSVDLVDKIRILLKLATGLSALHKAGVIHADIKPDNILLSSHNVSDTDVRLADFGLAEIRKINYDNGMTTLQETKHERGTPKYSAPEMLWDPFNLNAVATYAKPSEKTDMYAFAIVAWEVLSQQEPFDNVTEAQDLCVKVHQGVRPDIKMLPDKCPKAVLNMIENCWDGNRSKRKPASECVAILRQCYDQLVNLPYDIYLSYRYDTEYYQLINCIRNRLIDNGFKVTWMHDVECQLSSKSLSLSMNEPLKKRQELISQSKVIVTCLDEKYQTDDGCIAELQYNRIKKSNRPVIALFLEAQNERFPDNEIRVHCQMAASTTQVFDISSSTNAYMSTKATLASNITVSQQSTANTEDITQTTYTNTTIDESKSTEISTQFTFQNKLDLDLNLLGVSPLNIEIDKLSQYLNERKSLFGSQIIKAESVNNRSARSDVSSARSCVDEIYEHNHTNTNFEDVVANLDSNIDSTIISEISYINESNGENIAKNTKVSPRKYNIAASKDPSLFISPRELTMNSSINTSCSINTTFTKPVVKRLPIRVNRDSFQSDRSIESVIDTTNDAEQLNENDNFEIITEITNNQSGNEGGDITDDCNILLNIV